MLPYKTLIVINRNAATPVYRQIANRLVALIRDGLLQPGSALPGSRELALLLQVHRKTVIAAYEELYTQDWIETVPRKGVMVAPHLPEIKPGTFKAMPLATAYAGTPGFSFAKTPAYPSQAAHAGAHRLIIDDGFPDIRIAPLDLLMKEYRGLFHRAAMQRRIIYGDPAGAINLRTAIARFLADTRGMPVGPENILVSSGAQMAIFITAKMLLGPGATVMVGDPNYFMANRIFEQVGAKLVRIPVDDNGELVDVIEKKCRKKKPDLLYIIPHHHHPTTVTLSADRRMKLLQLIREYRLPVMEDDYDYDFHYSRSPVLPLASADHGGNVIYIGSLAKSLAPTIRVGYMVAPQGFIMEAAQQRRMIDMRGDTLLEEALALLFQNGQMQRHLKQSVKRYHQRRDSFCALLQKELDGKINFSIPSGGMAVWAQFHKSHPLPDIARRASAQGLYMSDGRFYQSGTANDNALRMGFASLSEAEMEESISILKKII
jgi:GntR family transcriptional regulator/MocR family aminotransferase